jgi:VCBS repeat-containing protein
MNLCSPQGMTFAFIYAIDPSTINLALLRTRGMHIRPKFSALFVCFLLAGVLIGFPESGLGQTERVEPEPLLKPATIEAPGLPILNDAVVKRQRVVQVDTTLLDAGRVPEELQLQLFDDVRYTARLLWSETGCDGSLAWIGRTVEQPNSRITLVAHGQQVSATIWVAGLRFDVRPWEGDLHIVQQLDSEALSSGEAASAGSGIRSPAAADQVLVRGDSMTDAEHQVLVLVNEERSKNGLSPLSPDDRLTAAARGHSQDMSDNSFCSHDSSDGGTYSDRIEQAGYKPWSALGENVACGFSTPEAAMDAWMNSSGHRANILSDSYCDLGVGTVGLYWTQDFGRLSGVTDCSTANHNPNAAFSAQPSSGTAPLAVNFDAGASDDPDGDGLSFYWDLGDGQTATEAALVHTYTGPGLYTVRLTVSDGRGGSDTSQQQITVRSDDNTAPRAADDAYVCDQGGSLSIAAPGVLSNDADDQNPDALGAVLVSAPDHGTLALNADGSFEYQPAPDFAGQDHFTYQATDGQYQSQPATVTINVQNAPSSAGSSDSGDSGSGGGGGCFIETLTVRDLACW